MKSALENEFLNLLEENQNIVHKICRVYTTNESDHKDLFQEITIQLWNSYMSFKGDSKFSTWMYRVGLNTAISLYRKSIKRVKTQDISGFSYKLKSSEYDPTKERQLNKLYDAINHLSDIEKALVFLYLEDKPYREIAEALGIKETNARVKMNRAKQKLKLILNP